MNKLKDFARQSNFNI